MEDLLGDIAYRSWWRALMISNIFYACEEPRFQHRAIDDSSLRGFYEHIMRTDVLALKQAYENSNPDILRTTVRNFLDYVKADPAPPNPPLHISSDYPTGFIRQRQARPHKVRPHVTQPYVPDCPPQQADVIPDSPPQQVDQETSQWAGEGTSQWAKRGLPSGLAKGLLSGPAMRLLSGPGRGVLHGLARGLLSGLARVVLSGLARGLLSGPARGVLSGRLV